MFSRVSSKSVVSVLGFVFVLSLFIGLPGAIAQDEECGVYPVGGEIFGCPDDCLFTMDFRLEDCEFETRGINPYFILKPGYRLVLQTPADAEEPEKSVETVLCDTKVINFDGRRIRTRVVEERAYELEIEEGEVVEEKLIEISLNYFAICKKTNAVYYFGEFSQDCENGFTEDEQMCEGEDGDDPTLPLTTGSWEAGVRDAKPGLIMPGTPLIGAKYFQEIAEEDNAVDRGEISAVELENVEVPAGTFSGCIEINDTNPTEGVCDLGEDVKYYCPGVGLVQDQELLLVKYGFVGCDDDDDDSDDDDDDDHDKRKRWGRR